MNCANGVPEDTYVSKSEKIDSFEKKLKEVNVWI